MYFETNKNKNLDICDVICICKWLSFSFENKIVHVESIIDYILFEIVIMMNAVRTSHAYIQFFDWPKINQRK